MLGHPFFFYIGIGHDDNFIPFIDQMGGGAHDLDSPAAPVAGDDIGLVAGAVGQIGYQDLLINPGSVHQVPIDGNTAVVVDQGLGDRDPVEF